MGKCIIVRRGLDTSDATATASKILSGYTAYAKGSKITGNYNPTSVSYGTLSLTASDFGFNVYVGGTSSNVAPSYPNASVSGIVVPCVFGIYPTYRTYTISGAITQLQSGLYRLTGSGSITGNPA